MPPNLLNYLLYQTGWLAAVVGAGRGHPWLGMLVALTLVGAHVALTKPRRSELTLVLVSGLVGLVVDSLLVAMGLLSFPSGSAVSWLCPPWIIVMWMQFATTLRFSLEWIGRRPMVAAMFGAIGGPLAYVIGERLGAVELGAPPAATLLILGTMWAGAVPMLSALAGRDPRPYYRRLTLAPRG